MTLKNSINTIEVIIVSQADIVYGVNDTVGWNNFIHIKKKIGSF